MASLLAEQPELVIPLFLGGGVFLCMIIGGCMKHWENNEAGKRDHELKMEMLTRGMSADDIERVLAAKAARAADPKETIAHAAKV